MVVVAIHPIIDTGTLYKGKQFYCKSFVEHIAFIFFGIVHKRRYVVRYYRCFSGTFFCGFIFNKFNAVFMKLAKHR